MELGCVDSIPVRPERKWEEPRIVRGLRGKDAQALDEARLEASEAEDLRYIRDTILLLTGGCEICQHSTGPYCNKLRRPIRPGDPRCEFFARRLPEDPDKARKAQERHVISERFGISENRSVRRLTGAD